MKHTRQLPQNTLLTMWMNTKAVKDVRYKLRVSDCSTYQKFMWDDQEILPCGNLTRKFHSIECTFPLTQYCTIYEATFSDSRRLVAEDEHDVQASSSDRLAAPVYVSTALDLAMHWFMTLILMTFA
jgi:hypothetical protein